MNEAEIFHNCLVKWGRISQTLMIIEELTEFQLELIHTTRSIKPFDRQKLIEEYVDVSIMLDQFRIMYYFDEDEVLKIRNEKLNRLLELLNDEKYD